MIAEGRPASDAVAVWLLALGVTLGYASLIYVFGALLVPVQEATGWTKPQMALGPTLALLAAAALSPLNGRLVDRGFGVELMAGGAILGGLALLAVGQARGLAQWYLAWIAVGPAMTATLYETCFAFLTRRLGPLARPAIIRVTLLGGLASTLAFPLGAFIAHHGGWRWAFAGFAGLEIAVAAPAFWLGGRLLRRTERLGAPQPPVATGAARRALRTRGFWLLTAALALSTMNHSVLSTYFIPVFAGLGAGQALAVAAAATVGPFQVAGRLVLMLMGASAPVRGSTLLAFGGLALASGLLLAAGIAPLLIFAFAVIQGASIGILSILRPLIVAETLGTEGFGAISGAISIGPLLATAAAPALGAGLFASGGSALVAAVCLAMAGTGLALTLAVRREV
jgi:MFS family permease